MAPLTKKSSSDDTPNPDNPSLPEHILEHLILRSLPFKSLKRFQCISKRYRSLINHDPLFPSEQARLLSPSSVDLVQLSENGLSFLINPEFNGVSDPSLKFPGNLPSNLQILCSTNGLLLLYGYFEDLQQLLCLCNPATQEKVSVPITQEMRVRCTGLVFDPSITPNRYILVSPCSDRGSHSFYIFRSDTGKWSWSNKKVPADEFFSCQKIIHTQGVVYWQLHMEILWYNTEKDLAGSVPLPTTQGCWSIGVYAGAVICCRTWLSVVDVWRLTNGIHWNRLHQIRCDSIQLNYTWLKTKSRLFRPLAFDGQFVYLLDFLNQEVHANMRSYTEILGYNMCKQQLEQKCRIDTTRFTLDEQVYDYHNSMAPVPKILG